MVKVLYNYKLVYVILKSEDFPVYEALHQIRYSE